MSESTGPSPRPDDVGTTLSRAESVRKARRRRRRWIVYGSLAALVWGFWVWQPWEFDILVRKPSGPNPRVDPDSKKLFSKGTRVLVITAHPDDSEFYIGGTLHLLSKTATMHQIICTDGDKSYYWIFTNADENRKVRREEALAAYRAWLGQSLLFLGYPDGRLRVTDELVGKIVAEIQSFRPEYVLAFDGEYPPRFSHQDHRRSGDAALRAVQEAGVPLWLMQFSTNGANYFIDITDVWEDKEKLLGIHKSQFHDERLQRVTNMVAGMAETDGEQIGVGLAEGFRCTRFP